MLFNSFHFLVFFPVVATLYFLLPHRFRWGLLLAASCYFYDTPYHLNQQGRRVRTERLIDSLKIALGLE